MQVAQARVSPGNPLAKVLTELGYISQRELAEAARVKVEKILTDLYTWKEGTYQFATKSLPKGAIDLELSTSRLLFASIRRVQDRDWVLRQLGSLDTVLTPTASFPQFLAETEPEPLAAEVLKLADGVKTVKQIGSVSSLGEFEVCKVLAAALVAGALSRDGAPAIPASDDAFSFPQAQESFSFPPPPSPSFGNETDGHPCSRSVLLRIDELRHDLPGGGREAPSPGGRRGQNRIRSGASSLERRARKPRRPSVSELVIDEPEPATETPGRNPPRPKNRRGGGGSGGSASGILKWLAVAGLAGAAAFSVYYFVWPLVGGGGKRDELRLRDHAHELGPNNDHRSRAPPRRTAAPATISVAPGTQEPARRPRSPPLPSLPQSLLARERPALRAPPRRRGPRIRYLRRPQALPSRRPGRPRRGAGRAAMGGLFSKAEISPQPPAHFSGKSRAAAPTSSRSRSVFTATRRTRADSSPEPRARATSTSSPLRSKDEAASASSGVSTIPAKPPSAELPLFRAVCARETWLRSRFRAFSDSFERFA